MDRPAARRRTRLGGVLHGRVICAHADRVRRSLSAGHDRDRPVGGDASEKLEGLRPRRPQPASLHEHGDGLRHLVRRRKRALRFGRVLQERAGRHHRRSLRLLRLPGHRRLALRARVLPHGPAHHRRLLSQALWPRHGARYQRDHRHLLSRLDRGAADGPRPGFFDPDGRRHPAQDGKFEFWPKGGAKEWLAFVTAFLTLAIGSIPQQDIFQRVTSAKNERTAIAGSLLGGVVYFGFVFVPIYIVCAGLLIDPLYPTMTDRQFLLTLRIVLVSFTLAALVFALNSKQTMYDMVQNAYTVTLVAALVPLAAGIFWKRANNLGALASCVCGLAGWLAAAFFAPDATVPPPLVGLSFSIVGMVVGALVPGGHAIAHAHHHSRPR